MTAPFRSPRPARRRARSGPRRRPPGPRWGLRIGAVTSVLVLAASGVGHAVVTGVESGIGRVDAFTGMSDRPGGGDGLNFLVVGTDGRDKLTPAEKQKYHLGGAPCHCTDTLMLVHLSADRDRASVVSLPRDSYAEVPAHTDAVTGAAARQARHQAERGLRRGRPQPDRADRRAHDGGAYRPLPGGRLHQLHAQRGRGRRGRDLHRTAAARQLYGPGSAGRQVASSTAARRSSTCAHGISTAPPTSAGCSASSVSWPPSSTRSPPPEC